MSGLESSTDEALGVRGADCGCCFIVDAVALRCLQSEANEYFDLYERAIQ